MTRNDIIRPFLPCGGKALQQPQRENMKKKWRLTQDTKYRDSLQRYVSSCGERY